jgi:hypothetical protein
MAERVAGLGLGRRDVAVESMACEKVDELSQLRAGTPVVLRPGVRHSHSQCDDPCACRCLCCCTARPPGSALTAAVRARPAKHQNLTELDSRFQSNKVTPCMHYTGKARSTGGRHDGKLGVRHRPFRPAHCRA